MSFYTDNRKVCYVGDNLPERVVVAEAMTEYLADGIVAALNLTHVDVEDNNGVLRIVGPGVE